MEKIATRILSIAAICTFCGILVMVGMKQKAASPQEEEEPRTEYYFRATVIKVDGNHLLVEPLEEEQEYAES